MNENVSKNRWKKSHLAMENTTDFLNNETWKITQIENS